MPSKDRKSYWRFDRDETNRVSTERSAGRQPSADASSPLRKGGRGAATSLATQPGPDKRRLDASILRASIDSGRGRDKIAYPDPAAAPLGTDDEAAGTPATPERVATAMRHELPPEARTRRSPASAASGSRTMLALAVAGMAALAFAFLVVVL